MFMFILYHVKANFVLVTIISLIYIRDIFKRNASLLDRLFQYTIISFKHIPNADLANIIHNKNEIIRQIVARNRFGI